MHRINKYNNKMSTPKQCNFMSIYIQLKIVYVHTPATKQKQSIVCMPIIFVVGAIVEHSALFVADWLAVVVRSFVCTIRLLISSWQATTHSSSSSSLVIVFFFDLTWFDLASSTDYFSFYYFGLMCVHVHVFLRNWKSPFRILLDCHFSKTIECKLNLLKCMHIFHQTFIERSIRKYLFRYEKPKQTDAD